MGDPEVVTRRAPTTREAEWTARPQPLDTFASPQAPVHPRTSDDPRVIKVCAAFSLMRGQAQVLLCIFDGDGVTVEEMAKAAGVRSSSAKRYAGHVREFASLGLICRKGLWTLAPPSRRKVAEVLGEADRP